MPQDKKQVKAKVVSKVPIKRVKEIADSLMKESNRKKEVAYNQERIGKSLVKKGLGDKVDTYWFSDGKLGIGKQEALPTGRQRLEIARKARESASADSAKSVRLSKISKGK